MRARFSRKLGGLLVAASILAGCGSAAPGSTSATTAPAAPTVAPPATVPVARSTAAAKSSVDELRAAERPRLNEFPRGQGRTLEQVARVASSTAQLSAATGFYNLGTTRYAFGLNVPGGGFIYAPTAVYLATSPGAPAIGPYLAPADPLTVAPNIAARRTIRTRSRPSTTPKCHFRTRACTRFWS